MGPLEGVRVVELGVWIAGPAAGGILADWGADVVKIEPPGVGDPARLFARMLGADLPFNPPFEMDNRSKRSIGLDLTAPEGRALGLELIDRADVFLTNVRPAGLRGSASTPRACSRGIRASSTARSPATAARARTPTRPPTTSPASGRARGSRTC